MGRDDGDGFTIDLLAASIRADAADTRLFLEVIAARLQEALPDVVEVRRQRGLLRRTHPVQALLVQLGDRRFELHHHPHAVQARIAMLSRGITLKTEETSLDAWIDALSWALDQRARHSAETRAALERLIR